MQNKVRQQALQTATDNTKRVLYNFVEGITDPQKTTVNCTLTGLSERYIQMQPERLSGNELTALCTVTNPADNSYAPLHIKRILDRCKPIGDRVFPAYGNGGSHPSIIGQVYTDIKIQTVS
jgi:hypothetical protein